MLHAIVFGTCLWADVTVAFQIKDVGMGTTCGGSAIGHDAAFANFIQTHGRSYEVGSAEFERRREIFTVQHAKVEQQNCRAGKRWTAAINKFADRTEVELAKQHGFNRRAKTSTAAHNLGYTRLSSTHAIGSPVPSEITYKNLTAMQKDEIMDQGQCGSCWAVATTLTLRAHSELHATDTKFSTQELVSCSPNVKHCGGSGGCDGSTGELAFEYIMKHGLSTEEDFPYEGKTGECPKSLETSAEDGAGGASIGMTGWTKLSSNKLEPLQRALVEKGPAAVSVAADDYWFFYSSGIMDTCSTDDPIINHLVVLIGYGKDDKTGYWQIQNSWGSSWGEDGHMKVLRTDDEETFCGMDSKPQDGVACEGENDPVKVCGHCGILFDAVVPTFAKDFKTKKKESKPASKSSAPAPRTRGKFGSVLPKGFR